MQYSDNVVQFYPNRLTVTTHKKPRFDVVDKYYNATIKKLENLKIKKTSVNLSKNSKKNIRDSIMGMYVLSKPRTVKTPHNKEIYNFRQSFVTLTLPAAQMHSDVEIKGALNHFLTNVRRALKIENYVWKAELQKNENIHFHLSFDKYAHYQAIRYYWLLALKPLGYIDAYSTKFSAMSLAQYAKHRNLTLVAASSAYADGCRSRWRVPNCVDVSSVRTANDVSNYLSKYFAKSDEGDIDPERIAAFGRVWSRSQSLSRLKYKNKFLYSEVKELLASLTISKVLKKVSYDFSTVYYINFKKMDGAFKKFFYMLLHSNASRYDYPIPYS